MESQIVARQNATVQLKGLRFALAMLGCLLAFGLGAFLIVASFKVAFTPAKAAPSSFHSLAGKTNIKPTPVALPKADSPLAKRMSTDALAIAIGVSNTIDAWTSLPPADLPILSSKTGWTLSYNGQVYASGGVHEGNKVSGKVWQDGAWCVQVSNPKSKSSTIVRSDGTKPVTGVCPKTM